VVTRRRAAQAAGGAGRTGPVGRDDVLGQPSRVVDQAIAGCGHLRGASAALLLPGFLLLARVGLISWFVYR
jgi:hypothetical protein